MLSCFGANLAFGQRHGGTEATKDTVLIKVDSLKAAIVTAVARPRLKRDTIEYNTEHMLLQHNADVEELLRRLPGVLIDANGNITYNGEKIQHLLVDGEDVFGDDPTVVTRNFDASRISRVQILDRKSEQALFTGVDDGTRVKTINLVMKESERNGFSGKAEVGGDTRGLYNINGTFARFKGRKQLTAFGLSSNTGILGFSDNAAASPGTARFQAGSADPLGASAGTGIPHFDVGGGHYSNTWGGMGNHVSGNYQYGHLTSEPESATSTLQIIADSVYAQQQQSWSINQEDQQWGHGVLDWAPSRRMTWRFELNGSRARGRNEFGALSTNKFNDTLVNTSQRSIHDNLNQSSLGGNIFWKLNLGKKRDNTVSIITGLSKTDAVTNGFLYSIDHYFQPTGQLQGADTADQRKQIASNALMGTANISFVKPLWKGTSLSGFYEVQFTENKPLQFTYANVSGKYDVEVDSLSSELDSKTINQQAGLILQSKLGRLDYMIAEYWDAFDYHQKDFLSSGITVMTLPSWASRLKLSYAANSTTFLQFNYSKAIQLPTMTQLQPAINNSDPLHITLGNPDLKPAFMQSYVLDLRRSKVCLVNLNISLSLTSDAISSKTSTDSLGKQISWPVNVNGVGNATINFSISRKLLGIDVGLHAGEYYSRTVGFINVQRNQTDAYSERAGLRLSKFVKDWVLIELNTKFSYIDQTNSINKAAPLSYWMQNHMGSVTVLLVRHYEFNSNATFTWQEKTNALASNAAVTLWNGYISHSYMKDKLVIKAQINNILNKNAGIYRSSIGNVTTQNSANILGRNWMLSVVYHFEKKLKPE